MHRPSGIFNDGIFPFAMGQSFEASDEQLVCIQAMNDAEDEFERALDQALRTERQPDDAEHILVSLLNSWRCVRRARASAGFLVADDGFKTPAPPRKCPAPADVICIYGRLMQGGQFWGHCTRCAKATGGVPR